MVGRQVLLFALVVSAPVAMPTSASACECGARPVGQNALAEAKIVALGRLVGVHRTVLPNSAATVFAQSQVPLVPVDRYDFELSEAWKGAPGPSVSLFHIGCCVCEYEPFVLGREYLLYLTDHSSVFPGRLMASFCFPNAPRESATKELAFLGPPTAHYPIIRTRRPLRLMLRDLATRPLALSLDLATAYAVRRNWPSRAEVMLIWVLILLTPPTVIATLISLVSRRWRRS